MSQEKGLILWESHKFPAEPNAVGVCGIKLT